MLWATGLTCVLLLTDRDRQGCRSRAGRCSYSATLGYRCGPAILGYRCGPAALGYRCGSAALCYRCGPATLGYRCGTATRAYTIADNCSLLHLLSKSHRQGAGHVFCCMKTDQVPSLAAAVTFIDCTYTVQ